MSAKPVIRHMAIHTIPHADQRYPTVGDWTIHGDSLVVRVSDAGDWRVNAVVAIHELVEALLCFDRSVSQEEVDRWDTIEAVELDEPGESPFAPYAREHRAATVHEFALLDAFDIPIATYEAALDALEDGNAAR